MAEEASKVLTGTTSKVLSNIERAQNLVTDSVAKRVRQAEASANMMLGNVSDMTNIRRKRPSISSLDRGLHSNIQFSHNFSSNYELDITDIDDHVSPTPSSEDVSKSRETICSTPTKTHDSVSDEEISFDMEHFNNKLDEARMEMKNMSENKEEELVQIVTNIIFNILWRGKSGKTKKEALNSLYQSQGQAIASINMLALNNKLYTSHACLKRKLTELCIQVIELAVFTI